MKTRILFVDDEPNVLEGLKRMLRGKRDEWDLAFAGTGPEALEILEREPFDVVVSDMRMPGMDGAQLLTEVQRRHPLIVRIVLSGQSDQAMILQSVRPAHQYLTKPCDAETLKNTIERSNQLRDLLTDNTLRQIVSQMETLPSLPSLYAEIMREVESEYSSMQKIGQIISRDIGMTAKVLQLVNSAFFGHCRHVSSPVQASELLGLETIKSLVIHVHIFSQFKHATLPSSFMNRLWDHSLATGIYAQTIAKLEKLGRTVIDDAFMAGVLHDAGKLILAANFPKRYRQALLEALKNKTSLEESEQQIFGVGHAEVGAYLLALWGLPQPIVGAVAFHHRPRQNQCEKISFCTMVHAANYLEKLARGQEEEKAAARVDQDYLAGLGLLEKLPVWLEVCQQAIQEGESDAT
ncbi:MAG: hypothetical protein A2Y80_03490 [Deltaproteobacteria bacterium RBG_13_58_19]|nr:MAG: hypothetical protein A2Y80_03490 [Deltaproteobacteria bacterium RBG_13_58_19]